MRIERKLLATTAALVIGFSAGAVANAAPTSAPWDGAYIGANVGANIASGNFSLPGDQGDVLQGADNTQTAVTGGGQIGFNHQFNGPYVIGLEGDIVDTSATPTVTACNVRDGCFTSAHDSFTTFNNLHEGVGGHVRARLGYAAGPTLFYVAGGYSVLDTRMDLIGDCFNAANPTVPLIFNFSREKTVSGYNIGAGVEHAVTSHITLRAEYLYDDYGSQLYAGDGAEWNDRVIHLTNSNIRVAANYRF
ncbi:MAG TPA: outer membrane beta-barrel protein [Caulobacteraceae bacterium]|jgi:outer membrane immunogenic protein